MDQLKASLDSQLGTALCEAEDSLWRQPTPVVMRR